MAYGSDSRGLSTIDLEVSFVHYVFLSSLGVWLWVDVSVRGLAMHVEKRGSFGFLLQSKSLTTGGCENGHFCRCGGSYFASRLSDIARAIFALNTHFSEQSYRRSEAEKRPSISTFARFFSPLARNASKEFWIFVYVSAHSSTQSPGTLYHKRLSVHDI